MCISFGSQIRNIKQSLESLWQMTAFRLNFVSYGFFGGLVSFAQTILIITPSIIIPQTICAINKKIASGHSSFGYRSPNPTVV